MRVLRETQILVHAYIGDVPLSPKVYALLSVRMRSPCLAGYPSCKLP